MTLPMKKFDTSLPIDEALPRLTAALRRTTPPCWWRRPAPARPRACRWCCSMSRGRRARKSWCWSRAGSPPAPRPRAWPRRSARRSATRSACACASARKVSQAHAHRGRHRGHLHAADPRRSVARRRRRRAVRRISRALARRRPRPRAGARRAAGPARGPEAPGDVGDARRRAGRGAARRRAGGREPGPQLSGRNALSRPRCRARAIERQVADAVERALRAETGSLLVFLPGAGEIRRTETLLKERVRDPTVDIVALYGALDAREQDRAIAPAPPGRRKVVLATSIAETSLTIEGVRVVIDSGLARVPRYEPDVGLTRLETVRVSRAAADQRRGRAGRTEPGVCYRLWDEPQTGSLEPYTQPEILSADLSSLPARSGAMGRARSGQRSPSSIRRRAAALSEARALLRELGALDARRPHHRRRPQAAPAAAAAAAGAHGGRCRARDGAGALAAEIAAVLTERGLGGDDPDLRPPARPVPPRPLAPRRGRARRWRGGGRNFAGRATESRGRVLIALGVACSRSPIPTASPRTAAASGGIPARQWARRQGRSGLGAGARAVPRRRRIDRRGGGEPHRAGGADHARGDRGALRRRDREREAVAFDAARRRCARGARAGSARWRWPSRPGRSSRRRDRTLAGRGHRRARHRRLPWSKAATAMARPRRVPAPRGRRGMARSVRRGAGAERGRMAGAVPRPARPRWRKSPPTILPPRSMRLLPWALAPAARRRGADAFHRAVRLARADRLRGARQGRSSRSACRNCSGSPAIRPSPAAACR